MKRYNNYIYTRYIACINISKKNIQMTYTVILRNF